MLVIRIIMMSSGPVHEVPVSYCDGHHPHQYNDYDFLRIITGLILGELGWYLSVCLERIIRKNTCF